VTSMRSKARKWLLVTGSTVGTVMALACVVMYVNCREFQREMGWSLREARGPWPKERVGEAVIVSFPRTNDLSSIERELAEVLKKEDVGYFDGSECLRTRCSMFMYGPAAVPLLDVVRPILKESPQIRAGTVYLRLSPVRENHAVLLSEKL
jgi:hypothetical protein